MSWLCLGWACWVLCLDLTGPIPSYCWMCFSILACIVRVQYGLEVLTPGKEIFTCSITEGKTRGVDAEKMSIVSGCTVHFLSFLLLN